MLSPCNTEAPFGMNSHQLTRGCIWCFCETQVPRGFLQCLEFHNDAVCVQTHLMRTVQPLLTVGAEHSVKIKQLDVRTVYWNECECSCAECKGMTKCGSQPVPLPEWSELTDV